MSIVCLSTYITLSLVSFSPDNDALTLSNGALKASVLWTAIIEHPREKVVLTTTDRKVLTEPTSFHTSANIHNQTLQPSIRSMSPPCSYTIKARVSSPIWMVVSHFKYNHASEELLQQMGNDGHIQLLKGHPKTIAPIPTVCLGSIEFWTFRPFLYPKIC